MMTKSAELKSFEDECDRLMSLADKIKELVVLVSCLRETALSVAAKTNEILELYKEEILRRAAKVREENEKFER